MHGKCSCAKFVGCFHISDTSKMRTYGTKHPWMDLETSHRPCWQTILAQYWPNIDILVNPGYWRHCVKVASTTVMLIGISILFLVFGIPVNVYMFGYAYGTFLTDTAEKLAARYLFYAATHILVCTNTVSALDKGLLCSLHSQVAYGIIELTNNCVIAATYRLHRLGLYGRCSGVLCLTSKCGACPDSRLQCVVA